MMTTTLTGHRTRATVQSDGRITITDLPLRPGDEVEVIVFTPEERGERVPLDELRNRLRGSVLRDDDPFGPATPLDDWDAAR